MAKKESRRDGQAAVLATAGMTEEIALTPELAAAGVPTFTLRADDAFGLDCMMLIARAARESKALTPEAVALIARIEREFELCEEANR